METGSATGAALAMDMVNRSIESMNGVIKQSTDAEQALSDKLVHATAEQKVQDLKDEGIGQALNLLA